MSDPRIALAMVTTTNSMETACGFQWIMILLEQHGWVPHFFYASSTYTVQGRNAVSFDLLEAADEWDSVLLYDLDQIPPRHTDPKGTTLLMHLQALAADPTLHIVGGLVHMRAYPFPPIAYTVSSWDGSATPLHIDLATMTPLLTKKRGLLKVDAVGTGAMLIRKEVLTDLAERKGFPAHALWTTPERVPADPSAPRKFWVLGEDLDFCRQAGEAGFNIYLDTEFENGHVEDQIIGSKNYLMAQRAMEEQREREAARRIVQAQNRDQIYVPPGAAFPPGRTPKSLRSPGGG